MCGIVGVSPAVEISSFKRILKSVAHRGPDGEGIWQDPEGRIQLGHRRLSIIDLSSDGYQPMSFNEFTIVFNGEIYNYIELKNELQKKGYSFNTHTDTEVLLKAFHCWGEKCLPMLNGMWAFAIFNSNTKSLFLCRDRFGEKPLYYFFDQERFCFASEVQSIHKMLGNSHPLNNRVITELISGRNSWHGREDTYLANVKVLQAGSYLRWNFAGVLELKKWYKLEARIVPDKFSDQAETLKSILIDSCQLRLRSDVPVGTCLSGGVDSGSITAIINGSLITEKNNNTHRSFCAAFPNTPIDESGKAARLANQLGAKLDVIKVESPSPDELSLAMQSCDGPMHALAFYPIWKLYQYIRSQNIIVTLDGQGPDEMLGGYRPLIQAVQFAYRSFSPLYLYDVFRTYRDQGESPQFSSKTWAKQALKSTLVNESKRLIKRAMFRNGSEFGSHPYRTNPLDEELYREFFSDPLPGILQQYDRCSMAHGVECRMPFLDYRVVEFIFSLMPQSKVGGGYTKHILRESVKGLLPEETRLDKIKIGFNAPIVDWYRGPLREWMLDWMGDKSFRESSFFDGKDLKKEFEIFLKNSKPNWDEAWKFWGSIHYVWWNNNVKNTSWS
jgi:asparagine synthase (glutamine-hydrolysing)